MGIKKQHNVAVRKKPQALTFLDKKQHQRSYNFVALVTFFYLLPPGSFSLQGQLGPMDSSCPTTKHFSLSEEHFEKSELGNLILFSMLCSLLYFSP